MRPPKYPFYLILSAALIAICSLGAFAADTSSDYGSLSRLTSDQLLDQGRDFFEKREAGNALTRFLIVGERFDDSAPLAEKEASIRALNNAGCVYKYFYYDYPRAYYYFNQAFELSEAIGFLEIQPLIMVNMGDLFNDYASIYNSETMEAKAMELFEDSFRQSVKNGDWELMTTAFYNLSSGHKDIDLSQYKEIFSDRIPADTPDLEFVRLQFRGIDKMQKGEFAEARKFFERQMAAVSTKWEANRDTISSLMNIAMTYSSEGNHAKTIEILRDALNFSDRSHQPELTAEIALQLSESYLSAGDSASYYKFHNYYLEKRDQLHNSRLSNIGEMKYLSDLKKEEKKARAVAVRQRIYGYFAIALIIVLLTITVCAWLIWRQNRSLKSRNETLFEQYTRLLEADNSRREESKETGKYMKSGLDNTRRQALLDKIKTILDNPETICSPDFSLKQLAELSDSNTTYVSQVINESYGVSFSTLLGNQRVRLMCHRLSETDMYANFTVEGIANSVGFKSRTAFLNAFKREVGLSPSEYIRMANMKKNENKPS